MSLDSCRCDICREMCHRPCRPSPSQMEDLQIAGLTKHSLWHIGPIPQPRTKDPSKYSTCVFFDDSTGLCTLHDRGLKPIEGQLVYHTGDVMSEDNWIEEGLELEWGDYSSKEVEDMFDWD